MSEAQITQLLTVGETAALLKRHPSTIYRRLESGEWEAFSWKDGKDWRIEHDGLMAHMRSHKIGTRRPVEDPMPSAGGGSRDRFRAMFAQRMGAE